VRQIHWAHRESGTNLAREPIHGQRVVSVPSGRMVA
jgi:hypothetical protein